MPSCPRCAAVLSAYNPGELCRPCSPHATTTASHSEGCAIHGHANWNEHKRRCRTCENERLRRKRAVKA